MCIVIDCYLFLHILLLYFRLGETCSHVGSILYKIEAAVRFGMTTTVPTELPCEWNQTFVRSVSGCEISNVNLYSKKAKEKLKSPSFPSKFRSNPSFDKNMAFLQKTKELKPSTVALHMFEEFVQDFQCEEETLTHLPPSLTTLYGEETLIDDFEALCNKIRLTASEVSYVEEATRN